MSKFNRGNTRAHKLTPLQVHEIREKYAREGRTQASLAREYKVVPETVGRIVRGETWQQFEAIETNFAIEARMVRAVEPKMQSDAAASLERFKKMQGIIDPPSPAAFSGYPIYILPEDTDPAVLDRFLGAVHKEVVTATIKAEKAKAIDNELDNLVKGEKE